MTAGVGLKKLENQLRKLALPFVSAIVCAIVSFLIGQWLISVEDQAIAKNELKRTQEFDTHLLDHLKNVTEEGQYVTESISNYVVSSGATAETINSKQSRWLLDGLVATMPLWHNISVSPKNCIAAVAPIEGNASAVGYCLDSNPIEWTDIRVAIQQKKARILGPYKLAQGGTGFILHRPIFLKDGSYWGLVSAVITTDKLLQPLNEAAAEDGMFYKLTIGDDKNLDIRTMFSGLPSDAKYSHSKTLAIGSNTFTVTSSSKTIDVRSRDNVVRRMVIMMFAFPMLLFLVTYFGQKQRRTRRKLQEVSKLAPSVLFQIASHRDGTLTIDYISAGAKNLLGLDAEIILEDSRALTQVFKEADLVIAGARLRSAKSPGEIWSQKLELLNPTETRRWIQAEATFERISGGLFQWNGVFLDATEAVAHDEALALSANAFSVLDEGVAVLDKEFIVVTINPAITKATGYEPADVVGHSFKEFGADHNAGEVYEVLQQSLKLHGYWRGQIVNVYKDGRLSRDVLTFSAVKLPDGEISQIVMVMNSTHESLVDPISGLPNRTLFEDYLGQAIDKARDKSSLVALLHIGVTGIGAVNDSFGHKVGDQVLQEVGERLTQFTATGKCIGRIGDAEFGLYREFRGEEEDLDDLSRRILDALAQPFLFGDIKVLVTTSIGVALFPDDSTDVSELRTHADQAFKASLHDNVSKVSYFSKSFEDSAKARSYLTSYLQEAVHNQDIAFYYQPIVRLKDKKVTKAEVLSRWFDEHLGQVSPARFIPLAESSNLISDLGTQSLEDVLQTAQELKSKGKNVQFSVNVSPVEFMSAKFPRDKAETFAKYPDVNLGDLVFELTEGIFLNKRDLIEQRIAEFHAQGIKFAIDDFGTGYSSLSYLQQLDVDFIKIDKAFIDRIETEEGLALCKSIVDLSHALGMELIAEGVESEAQVKLLEQIGCEFAQGYFFSKPVPKSEFIALVD